MNRRKKEIQGLYSADEVEGSFWFLLAKVLLAREAKKKSLKEGTSPN